MKAGFKQLLQSFNHPDTLLVISKYPYQNEANSYHGVAVYTQQVVANLTSYSGKKVVVLVEDEYNRPPQLINEQLLIIPAFKNSHLWWVEILFWIRLFHKTQLIHLHSEFYHNGRPSQLAGVVPFLVWLKILNKRVYFIAHNIIDDFSFIATHLGKSRNGWFIKFLEKLAPWFYTLVAYTSHQVVVLDESIQNRLAKFIPTNKIFLSPIAIDHTSVQNAHRTKWRRKLGYKKTDIVLLCFGFMTTYKGVDWLIETIDTLNAHRSRRRYKILLVGGKAPSQTGKKHYEAFYQRLTEKAAAHPDILLTGFVSKLDIPQYFSAADLAVLPYRGILGASASWAEALKYGKPFILSTHLQSYLVNPAVKKLLEKHQLTLKDFTFSINKRSFKKSVNNLVEHQNKLMRMRHFTQDLAIHRSSEKQIAHELENIYAAPQAWRLPVQWNYTYDWFKKVLPNWATS